VLPRIGSELTGVLSTLGANPIWGPVLQDTTGAVTQNVMTYMQYRPYDKIVSLAIVPAAPTVAVGAKLQLQALGYFDNGSTQDLTAVATWKSDNPALAKVTSPGGVVSGVAAGTTRITATWTGLSAGTTVGVTGS
jgi:uncharacterized protein YjdB